MREMLVFLGYWRSSGEENGNSFQYSCLGNPVNGGAWWAAVHGVTKSWTESKQICKIVMQISLQPHIKKHSYEEMALRGLDHVSSLYKICCNITSVLYFNFLAVRHVRSIPVPQPGIEPAPPALKGEVLTTGPPGKYPHCNLLLQDSSETTERDPWGREACSTRITCLLGQVHCL